MLQKSSRRRPVTIIIAAINKHSQQRVLSGILTRFPSYPIGQDDHKVTFDAIIAAKVIIIF